MPKLCEFENCRCQATYGEFYGKPLRCNLHKEEYKLVSRLCREGNCKLIPSYNYQGNKQGIFCNIHKLEEMMNVKDKKCEYEKCNKLPTYNYEGESKKRFCVIHKLNAMVDILHKRCHHEGCLIRPTYNYINETTPLYCATHKLDDMIDIKHKKCNYEGCNIRPNYNYPNKTEAIYCTRHKLEGMVNIKSKRCEYEECDKIPNYNYKGQITAKYCVSHKLDGMIDIIHKKCNYETCNVRPNYNYPNKTEAIYCTRHKLDGMIDVKHKKCKANFCLGTLASDKYKGYCSPCFQHLFPNDPLSFQIRSKTKEIAVRDYINSIFEGFQHDTSLWTRNCDCTHRRRIDHRKLIGNTLLCIETDENQHRSYDKVDEEIRYDDLYMLHGGKFIYIRFNPDKFKKNGKSCNPMLYTRLPILREEIERQINRIENEQNTELLEIIKLFYDE
jgi:hypothetical protein